MSRKHDRRPRGHGARRGCSPAQYRTGRVAVRGRKRTVIASLMAGVVGFAILLSLAFDNLSSRAGTVVAQTENSTTVRGPTVEYPVALPSGYQAPTGLATDESNGVWFFAQGLINGSPQETLFHWSPTPQALTAYAVDVSSAALNAGLDTPIVVDQSGRAWLGINQSLLVATPGLAGLRVLSLPPVALGAPGSGLPSLPGPQPGDIAPIESLALGPGGTIVVARAFATELQVVDPSSLAVSSIPLPAGTALAGLGANDLASEADGGVIAAALYSGSGVHELGQYVNGTWSLTPAPCPAYAVAISASTLVVSGPGCVAAGTIPSAASGPVEITSLSVRGLPQGTPRAIALNGTTVLVDLGAGVVSARGGSQSGPVSLGETDPGPSVGGSGGGISTPVPIAMALVAPAGGGGAWFVPNGGAARVGQISA